MKSSHQRPPRRLPILLAFALVTSAHASVIVNIDYSPTGTGTFLYSVTITNNTLEDLAVVSLINGPIADSLISPSLMSPSGFLASYDSGSGIVDFLEGANAFTTNGTFGAFSFESIALPNTAFATYEALDISGGFITGMTTLVPEPTSLSLAVLAVLPTLLRRRR